MMAVKNLTCRAQLYEYDGESRLIRVRRKSDNAILQEYAYDALGRRVQSRTGVSPVIITTHVYAGGPECIAEYDSTTAEGGTRERWFVHGQEFPDPLVMVDLTKLGDNINVGQEEYLYYLKDMLGSVTALADAAGAVVERYVYDPYGKTTVTYADGVVQLPPLAKSYYHDSDLDGDIDITDSDHLTACLSPEAPEGPHEPMCVFVHDRNGDDRVDAQDQGVFVGLYTGSTINPAPAAWLRPDTAYFDANGDKELEAFDWQALHTCWIVSLSNEGLCEFVFDLDKDNTIDLDDYAELQRAYAGPGVPRAAGSVTSGASRFGNPFAWTAQRLDAAVGLYHFKYRSYSPILGRWLQRDPLGYIDAMTLYEYGVTSPLWWLDPLGLTKGGKQNIKPSFLTGEETLDELDAIEKSLREAGKTKAADDVAAWHKKQSRKKGCPGKGGRGGGGRGAAAVAGAVLGLLADHANALTQVASSAAYRSMLDAIAKGDLNEADDWAGELELELQAQGFALPAGNWWKMWKNVILPMLKEQLAKQECKGNKDKGDECTGNSS